ncbi:MAG: N-acetylglucosamine kinase [Candidatus Helarchaeota archaeon]
MYYLGVDGGGTKTAFILINEDGKIVSYQRKGNSYYVQVGFDKFRKILNAGITDVCKEVDIVISDINYSFFGIPAYGERKNDIPLLKEIVRDILQNDKFKCGNDAEAGWAGSLACQPGINLVGGTGAIGFGKDQYGNTARSGGWPYFCGDEGSAYWLGKKLISLFEKESDGREEKTPLYEIVRKKFNLKSDFDFITVVQKDLKMQREEIAKLNLLLLQAAEQDDKRALDIYKEAAYEHSLTVEAIINKLNFAENQEILVSYSGGVFKSGEYILKPLKDYISKDNIKLVEPILQPVSGAALYALEFDKKVISPEIINRLKNEEKKVLRI